MNPTHYVRLSERNQNIKSLAEAVQTFLECEEIKFKHTEYTGVFKFGLIGEHGYFQGYIATDEDKGTVRVKTLAPLVVPQSKRPQAAELLARINQHLALGVLELDMDSGTVACRTSIVLGESNLHHDVMEHLLYANWHVMDWFFPAINAVVFADVSPKEAIDKARCKQLRSRDNDESTRPDCFTRRLGDVWGSSMN